MNVPRKWRWVAAVAVPVAVALIAIVPDLLRDGRNGTPPSDPPATVKPSDLTLSTPPMPESWVLQLANAVYTDAEAEKISRSIHDFRVDYVRTVEFPARTAAFEWHLRAGPYDIDAPAGAFLISAMHPRLELQRSGRSAQEVVFNVPPANQGDYLMTVIMVSSKTNGILGETRRIVTSFAH